MRWVYENKKNRAGYAGVVGCDEVGRGCLAGPVVAAAVVFLQRPESRLLQEVNDSKILSAEKRKSLSEGIWKSAAAAAVGWASVGEIDRLNIHHASLLAMRRAVEKVLPALNTSVCLVVDGRFTVPGINIEQEAVVDGDAKIFSVAAASIVAKVYRDRLMEKHDRKFPSYGWRQNKGYGTIQHRQAILSLGPTPLHRRSFQLSSAV